MNREEAYTLLTKYLKNQNLVKHCLAAEAAMKAIYKRLHVENFDENQQNVWGITGLLHDVDYEIAKEKNQLDKHGLLIFDVEPHAIPEPIAHAIKSHNYQLTRVQPESELDWAITCSDQLTGLIVAAALIHPDKKLNSIDADFVIKRMNQPAFAKGAKREPVKLCEEKLGIPLKEFIEIILSAMQEISGEIGL